MKILKVLANPYLLIASFLFLVISGESIGGFYITYIVLALPHGGLHAVLAVCGIIVLIFNYHAKTRDYISFTMTVIGTLLLVSSLCFFFAGDPTHYNAGTFEHAVPSMTFVVFGILVLCSMTERFMNLTGIGNP